ncbi:MAG: hypothetical protein NTZ28_04440 [Nitrospirae bacterium]|nr:hypothetical protein [Nitrospirota bacterium]
MRSIGLLAGLLLVVALGGCLQAVRPVMSPPAWIHGTWGQEDLDMDYEFAATTMIQRIGNVSPELAGLYRRTGTHVDEVITDTLYSFTVPTESGGFMTQEFRKIGDDSISMTMRTDVGTIGPSTLHRQ